VHVLVLGGVAAHDDQVQLLLVFRGESRDGSPIRPAHGEPELRSDPSSKQLPLRNQGVAILRDLQPGRRRGIRRTSGVVAPAMAVAVLPAVRILPAMI
jgi:hypothetical protein